MTRITHAVTPRTEELYAAIAPLADWYFNDVFYDDDHSVGICCCDSIQRSEYAEGLLAMADRDYIKNRSHCNQSMLSVIRHYVAYHPMLGLFPANGPTIVTRAVAGSKSRPSCPNVGYATTAIGWCRLHLEFQAPEDFGEPEGLGNLITRVWKGAYVDVQAAIDSYLAAEAGRYAAWCTRFGKPSPEFVLDYELARIARELAAEMLAPEWDVEGAFELATATLAKLDAISLAR